MSIVRTALLLLLLPLPVAAAQESPPAKPDEIYIPYKDLRRVIEQKGRGVFLPYDEFERLWNAAHKTTPSAVNVSPVGAVLRQVSYVGRVNDEAAEVTATVQFEVLGDGWCRVDLRLGDVALRKARYVPASAADKSPGDPLIQATGHGHELLVRGQGRYTLELEFIKKLQLSPGRSILEFSPIPAAIATLEISVPIVGAEVRIEPMLAASTQPASTQPGDAEPALTLVKAFISPVERVNLSWAAKSELAGGLAGMVESEQRHGLTIGRTSVLDNVELVFNIHHAPRDRFDLRLPKEWRVLGLDAAQVQSWRMMESPEGPSLSVKLYEGQKDRYTLRLELERPIRGDAFNLDVPVLRLDGAAREQGVVAIRQPEGMRVQVARREGMSQIDPGELPEGLRDGAIVAMRFVTGDAALTASVARVEPKVSVRARQIAGIDDQTVHLSAAFDLNVEDAGIFSFKFFGSPDLQILDIGPTDLVEDFSSEDLLIGRMTTVRLRRKVLGAATVTVTAQRPRSAAADKEPIRPLDVPLDGIGGTYDAALVIAAKDHLEVKLVEQSGFKATPLRELSQRFSLNWPDAPRFPRVLGFEARDRQRVAPRGPAPGDRQPVVLAADVNLVRKKTRVTATVSTRVDLTDSQTRFDAVLTYNVLYAEVEELLFRTPAALTEERLTVTGDDIREKKIVPDAADKDWNHWRVTLARPTQGRIRVDLHWEDPRTTTQPSGERLGVPEIYPEGALDHVDGQIVLKKSENLQVDVQKADGLRSIDVSEVKLSDHRAGAHVAMAFDRPPFKLTLAATRQEFQEIAAIVVDRVFIEQVTSRDGDVSSRAAYVVQTQSSGNLRLTLPVGAKLVSTAWVNGRSVTPQRVSGQSRDVLIPLPSVGEGSRRAVVELAYSMSGSLGDFAAPGVQSDAPVQETRWLVWVPPDLEPISHDSAFLPADGDRPMSVRSSSGAAAAQAGWLSGGNGLNATLATEGTPLLFRRLGTSDRLHVSLWKGTTWRVLVNGAWIAIGLTAMRLAWRRRAMGALAFGVLGALLASGRPLLADQIVRQGVWGIGIVAVAWAVQWTFFHLPAWWSQHGGWTHVTPTPAPTRSAGEGASPSSALSSPSADPSSQEGSGHA